MKFQNTAINRSEDILEFSIFSEDSLVTIKAGKSGTDVRVGVEEGFKNITMATRQLAPTLEHKMADMAVIRYRLTCNISLIGAC